jgi:hypothetical protein
MEIIFNDFLRKFFFSSKYDAFSTTSLKEHIGKNQYFNHYNRYKERLARCLRNDTFVEQRW